MNVEPIPIGADNYAYLVWQPGERACAVVDPTTAGPVAARIDELGLELRWILATHHHWDHTAGIEELATRRVEVVSAEANRVRAVNRPVSGGDVLDVAGERATVIAVPGHTRGAVAYHLANCVFTGDTLFLAGCGRLFEGTPAEMYASLGRLASLPEETAVFCGHEYTEKNLTFAVELEPDNREIALRLEAVRATRGGGGGTMPGSVGEERRTNPFLRCHEPALRHATGETEPVAVFAALRRRRDWF